MSFATPAALFWAILAVPVVIFYLLKIRMRRVPVSSVMFWQEVFENNQQRTIRRRLRHLVSLLLQLLFLALLLFAAADPVSSHNGGPRRRMIVIVDNSASMQVPETPGTSRFEEARNRVQQLITSLRPQDEMAIISAGSQPEVICGLTSHQRSLHHRLNDLRISNGPTTVKQAAKLAGRLVGNHTEAEVIVVTDGCFPQADVIAQNKQSILSLVGSSAENVGITLFQVRRSDQDPLAWQILIEVSNASDSPATCQLEFRLDSSLLDVVPLKLTSGEVWRHVFEKTSASGGVLSAALNFEDGSSVNSLTADDTVQAVLPEVRRIPVTLVTEGNWFLQGVLQANDLVDLTVSSEIPATVSENTVLVLHQQTDSKLPAGNLFVVQPAASTDLWKLIDTLKQPLIGRRDEDNNLLRHVRLDNIQIPEAVRLQPTASHTTLFESVSGDPLYLHIPRVSGDVFVLPVNLNQGDLPLRTAFPIMLTNALSWFARTDRQLVEAMQTGLPAEIVLPADLQQAAERNNGQLTLVDPAGSLRTIRADGSKINTGPLTMSGIWTLGVSNSDDADDRGTKLSGPTMRLASNLCDRAESDVRPIVDSTRRRLPASAGTVSRPMWYCLVAAALLLILTEWILFQRRWIA